ncbi:MAG: AAA family ATPase [Candidatus Accumulibacter sp.]|jgi:exonuclease SbcC|nr:AAA family ATPase [Accumulibacter sp.]
MKILRIALENLASIAGAHEIDFRAEPLNSAGLFAISGPTGAGKSTLLDAICLALYGEVPRLDGVEGGHKNKDDIAQKDPRTLLRKGCASAYAEVDFLGGDHREYRARWEVSRARGKADGALQSADASFIRLSDHQSLATKITEVHALALEKTGLSYGQFVRAVILAQNQFSAFLKSKDDERAEILEALTGTERFTQISQAIFARAKAEQEKVVTLQNQLGGVVPFPEETRTAAETAVTVADSEFARLEKNIVDANEHKRWHDRLAELDTATANAAKRQTAAETALTAAAPRREKLQRHEHALPLAPQHTAVDETARAVSEKQTALGNVQAIKKTAAADAAASANDAKATDDKLAAVRTAFDTLQPALKHARELDAQATAAATARDKAARDHTNNAAADKAARDTHDAKTRARDALQKQLAARAPEKIQTVEAAAAAKLAAADHAIATLDPAEKLAGERAALDARRDALARFRTTRDERETAHAAASEKQTAVKDAETQLAASRAEIAELETAKIPAAEKEAATAAATLQRAEAAASDIAAQLRAALQDEAPCPVCGATAHPFAAHAPDADTALLRELGAAKNAAEKTLAQLRAAHGGIRRVLAEKEIALPQLRAAAAQAAATLAQKQSAAGKAGRLAGFDADVEEDAAALANAETILKNDAAALAAREKARRDAEAAVKNARAADADARRERETLRALQSQLATVTAALKPLADAADEAAKRCAATKTALAEADAALAKLHAVRRQLLDGKTADEAEATAKAALTAAEQAAAAAERKHAAATQAFAVAESRLNKAAADESDAKNRAAAAVRNLDAALAGTAAALNGPPLTRAELAALLAWPKAEIDREKTDLKQLDDERTKAGEELATHHRQRETQRDAAARLPLLSAAAALPSTAADIAALLETLAAARAATVKNADEKRANLKADDDKRIRAATLADAIQSAQKDAAPWAELSDFIGSAEGKKFRDLAQQYTLDILLRQANAQLAALSNRYRLERHAGSLGLEVLDHDMGGERRAVHTLSGGETFLVSLALALGLASLASNRLRVESLFIDEGFGSLDAETLNTVLDALMRLQSQGRKVGVISHVAEMSEKIPVQIQVVKTRSGASKIKIAGIDAALVDPAREAERAARQANAAAAGQIAAAILDALQTAPGGKLSAVLLNRQFTEKVILELALGQLQQAGKILRDGKSWSLVAECPDAIGPNDCASPPATVISP